MKRTLLTLLLVVGLAFSGVVTTASGVAFADSKSKSHSGWEGNSANNSNASHREREAERSGQPGRTVNPRDDENFFKKFFAWLASFLRNLFSRIFG